VSTQPPPDHARYYEAVTTEDERLQAVLAAIRADHDAGNLTTREAADNRIAALEAHLRHCQELRRTHLGDPAPQPVISHRFVAPGQVAPHLPAPDNCMECGFPAADHRD
jgi:hypothetical protein